MRYQSGSSRPLSSRQLSRIENNIDKSAERVSERLRKQGLHKLQGLTYQLVEEKAPVLQKTIRGLVNDFRSPSEATMGLHQFSTAAERGMLTGIAVMRGAVPVNSFQSYANNQASQLVDLRERLRTPAAYDLEDVLAIDGRFYSAYFGARPALAPLIDDDTLDTDNRNICQRCWLYGGAGGGIPESVSNFGAPTDRSCCQARNSPNSRRCSCSVIRTDI
jgi:hypothetical protein